MVNNKQKKAAQGIGTLIIFIALILVAAVAAAVLINTVGNLQGKAENTGKEIEQRLATGFTIIQIGTRDTSDSGINTTADSFEMRARLGPGSDAIKLEDITMALVTQRGSFPYSISRSGLPTTTNFTVTAISGDVSDGYADGSDVITFTFNASDNIGENEEFEITLFPGAGSAQRIALVTPPSLVNVYEVLK